MSTYPRTVFLASRAMLLIVLLVTHLHGAIPVKVVSNGAKLRSAPKEESLEIGSVNRGYSLLAFDLPSTGWVKVVAPKDFCLWVYGDLVRKSVVIAPGVVSVRAGPGIRYDQVGKLKQGDSVAVKGAYEDWLKVEPPPGSFLWIQRRCIGAEHAPAVPERGVDTVESKRDAAPEQAADDGPVVPQRTTVSPPTRPLVESKVILQIEPSYGGKTALSTRGGAPVTTPSPISSVSGVTQVPAQASSRNGLQQSDHVLPPSARLLGTSTRKGLLKPVGFLSFRSPSRYMLVETDAYGRTKVLCYVLGDRVRLSRMKGRRVTLRGREYSIRSIRYPAMLPDEITVEQ